MKTKLCGGLFRDETLGAISQSWTNQSGAILFNYSSPMKLVIFLFFFFFFVALVAFIERLEVPCTVLCTGTAALVYGLPGPPSELSDGPNTIFVHNKADLHFRSDNLKA